MIQEEARLQGLPPDEETPILDTFLEEREIGQNNEVKQQTFRKPQDNTGTPIQNTLRSIPAVLLVSALNLMLAVPFGSAYFAPVIPLGETEREALGIRMALLALAVGQAVYGSGVSSFDPVALWQIGELSPFYHKLAEIAAATGNEEAILPTTLYLLSLSTLALALIFYLLGKFGYGQLTYFFPTHVLLGLVGGVGIWLTTLSLTVSISPSRAPSGPLILSIWTPHFAVTVVSAAVLRILHYKFPKDKFMLLDPFFFLSIPLVFYAALYIFGINVQDVVDGGYFFADPEMTADDDTTTKYSSDWAEASKIWTNFQIAKVQWSSALTAMPTLLTTGLMGVMLTAPFIPATAMLFGKDTFDYNREFVAHGYANMLCAVASPGGLSVGLSYVITTVFKNVGGKGKVTSCVLSCMTLASFVYGPRFVVYVPRCLAGSLVLDIGIDLFLEAVVDPREKCDFLEYMSIWIILVIMNAFDMTAGLVAGLLAAVFTYALQSSLDKDPVRLACDATTVPSSRWRNAASLKILEDPRRGRARIGVFQLQGQIFFGNVGQVEREVFTFLDERRHTGPDIQMVVLDFSLVLGVDATAASFFEKMINRIQKQFDASTVMVSGPLGRDSMQMAEPPSTSRVVSRRSTMLNSTPPSIAFERQDHERTGSPHRRMSTMVRGPYDTLGAEVSIQGTSFETLDEALLSCEDNLIAKYDMASMLRSCRSFEYEEETIELLSDKFEEEDESVLRDLIKYFKRETRTKGDILWYYGDEGTSAKILLSGELCAYSNITSENRKKLRVIEAGDLVGLRSLILREKHLAALRCESECVLYTLARDSWTKLMNEKPKAAHLLYRVLARDLSRHLQHVSNEMYLSRSMLE